MSFVDVRVYDEAFTSDVLKIVRAMRLRPSGQARRVDAVATKGGHKRSYPWDRMELGDWFVVEIPESQTFASMKVRFKQVANRRDFEITCVKFIENGVTYIRVAKTYDGSVKALKEKVGVPASDGRWSERRKHRRENYK